MSNIINWSEYETLFTEILEGKEKNSPYDKPAYLEYVKLNKSRQDRWLKKGSLNEELKQSILSINDKQTWYAITEPWCGDAAHSLPFFKMMADLNSNIELKIVRRDTPPFMIEDYLTNGGKSVPKVIARNSMNEDLWVWGPRPKEAQNLYLEMRDNNLDFNDQKIKLQQWYNKDKGQSLQSEMDLHLHAVESL